MLLSVSVKEASLGSGQWLMQRHYVTGRSAEYRDFQVLSCAWNIASSPYHPRPRELCGEAVERMQALADKGESCDMATLDTAWLAHTPAHSACGCLHNIREIKMLSMDGEGDPCSG